LGVVSKDPHPNHCKAIYTNTGKLDPTQKFYQGAGPWLTTDGSNIYVSYSQHEIVENTGNPQEAPYKPDGEHPTSWVTKWKVVLATKVEKPYAAVPHKTNIISPEQIADRGPPETSQGGVVMKGGGRMVSLTTESAEASGVTSFGTNSVKILGNTTGTKK
jgi:hypothetical protein